MLFLYYVYKSKKTPIIQDITTSDRSFIIYILSEILRQDLSIYNLNQNMD